METYRPTDASAYTDWRQTDIPMMIGLDEAAETRFAERTALIPEDNPHYEVFRGRRFRANIMGGISFCCASLPIALWLKPTLSARLPKIASPGLIGVSFVCYATTLVCNRKQEKTQRRLALSLHEAYCAEAGVVANVRKDLNDDELFGRLIARVERDLAELLKDRETANELVVALLKNPKPLVGPLGDLTPMDEPTARIFARGCGV